MKNTAKHTVRTFPSSRLFTMDVGKIGMRKHHIKALIEIDVTDSRKQIRSLRRESGARASFTSWMLKCIARAITEHRQAHALRKGKRRLVLFDEVDISLLVEKTVDGEPVPIPLVLRNVDGRSLSEIHDEIENAKKTAVRDESGYVIEKKRKKEPIGLFTLLPQFIRLAVWKALLSDPFRLKKMMGTVVVTSVGMMGNVRGWLVPYSMHPACFAMGSIVKKPGVVNDGIAAREYLEMTVLLDHDVIDGAPAARFIARLVDLAEKGHGL